MLPRPWLATCAALLVLVTLPARSRSLGDLEQGTLFVWEVVNPKDTTGQPDYLAGTIHLALPPNKRLPQAALDRLTQSTCFVMEADIEALHPNMVVPFIFRRDKQSNQKYLKAPTWKWAVKQASALGFKAEQVARMEPWFLTTFLGLGPNDPDRSRDMLLRREAEDRDLPVLYLEKAIDQLTMMRSLPASYFYKQLEAIDETTAKKDALVDAYENGDLVKLEKTTFDKADMRQFPQVYQRMFYDRNARWVPALETIMRQHQAFVAVGLGHLIGDRGLLKTLAAKGYRITPVPMAIPTTPLDPNALSGGAAATSLMTTPGQR